VPPQSLSFYFLFQVPPAAPPSVFPPPPLPLQSEGPFWARMLTPCTLGDQSPFHWTRSRASLPVPSKLSNGSSLPPYMGAKPFWIISPAPPSSSRKLVRIVSFRVAASPFGTPLLLTFFDICDGSLFLLDCLPLFFSKAYTMFPLTPTILLYVLVYSLSHAVLSPFLLPPGGAPVFFLGRLCGYQPATKSHFLCSGGEAVDSEGFFEPFLSSPGPDFLFLILNFLQRLVFPGKVFCDPSNDFFYCEKLLPVLLVHIFRFYPPPSFSYH